MDQQSILAHSEIHFFSELTLTLEYIQLESSLKHTTDYQMIFLMTNIIGLPGIIECMHSIFILLGGCVRKHYSI